VTPRASATAGRRSALPAVIAVLAAAAAALGTGQPASALPSDDSPLPVTLILESLTPVAPRAGDTLIIRGTVANDSARTIPDVTARLRVGESPLPARDALTAVARAEWDDDGTIVDGTRTPEIPELLPGQTAPFTITIPLAALDLGDPGAYLLVVEAQSNPGDGNLERVGLRQTVLPWLPDPARSPVTGLVTLWPLTDVPAVDSQGVLLTDQIPAAIRPGGRLRVLLDAGAAREEAITWLVDPALLETVDAMSDGYRVSIDGDVVAGNAADDARTWIDGLRRVASQSDVMALPYAMPDDTALVRGGLGRNVIQSITSAAPAASSLLGTTVASTLAWPAGGLVDEPTLRTIADAAPRGVLVSGRQLTHTDPITPSGTAALPGSVGTGIAVVPDLRISATLAAGTAPGASAVEVRQRLLCDLAMIGLESPEQPRTVVMVPPPRWAPTSAYVSQILAAITSVPWIRPTSLPVLLGAEPSTTPRRLSPYPARAEADELPGAYVSRLATAEAGTALVGDVVSGTLTLTGSLRQALARAGSLWFRSDEVTGARITAGVDARAARALEGVRIVSRGTVTLPGETGVIPVSIANDLTSPVTVSLLLRATPSVRLTAAPVPPLTIEPGSTALVEVPAQVSGSEPVEVSVYLTSSSGVAFGEPSTLNVGSSAYSRAAAWVVGLAFAALVLMLLVNALRRLRAARARALSRPEPEVGPLPPGATDGPSPPGA